MEIRSKGNNLKYAGAGAIFGLIITPDLLFIGRSDFWASVVLFCGAMCTVAASAIITKIFEYVGTLLVDKIKLYISERKKKRHERRKSTRGNLKSVG